MDTQLASFASVRQLEILEAIEAANGSIRGAARALKLDPKTVRHHLDRLKIKAASKGYSPGHAGLAGDQLSPVERLKGRSIYLDVKSGQAEKVWIKTDIDAEKREAEIDAALDRRIERITPIEPRSLPDVLGPANILNQVTIADGHIGALAWNKETGSGDWDLNIARDTLLTGACWLMDNLPPAEELLLVILGDFTDTDGYLPLTPASKNLLDVDGRYPKIADVGAEVIESAVTHGLKRYRRIRLVIKPGNHDPLSAWWMRKLFTRVFEREPRVTVEQSLRPYWAMLFGKTMISTHHGDHAKLGELPGIFAADFAPMWGQATYRICHTGHMHHKHFIVHSGKEERGMMVYQHPTIAARNAWAANKGLAAARELLGHSYHANGAMAQTLHFSPEMLG
jgi:hypothetical protein